MCLTQEALTVRAPAEQHSAVLSRDLAHQLGEIRVDGRHLFECGLGRQLLPVRQRAPIDFFGVVQEALFR